MIITVNNKILELSIDLPDDIFDFVNREMINTIEFLEDKNNIILAIEDNIIGLPKYFFPFKDDVIIYECKQGAAFKIAPYEGEQEYINMEKIGITLEPPRRDVGIIINKELFGEVLGKTQIIKLKETSPQETIWKAVSKSILRDVYGHGVVGALHCQNGYIGRKFIPINCIISSEDILTQVNEENIFTRNNTINSNNKFYKFIVDNPYNYFSLKKSSRDILNGLGYVNPLRYPEQYYKIYEEEKTYRNLKNFDYLIKLNNPNLTITPFDNNDKENIIGNNCISSITQKKNSKLIFNLLNENFLKLYSNNLVIAGGFALSLYNHEDDINDVFDDIDIFIHSCTEDQTKMMIFNIIERIFTSNDRQLPDTRIGKAIDTTIKFVKSTDSENAFSITVSTRSREEIKIQFIKRIYSSPSEIIHGFDIDSSCILFDINSNSFYTTKRGYYSLTNKTNIINFNKLSPSYEYRLIKYFKRGYNIYIPQIRYFKENFIFDLNSLENKGGNIINAFILTNMKKPTTFISDYNNTYSTIENPNTVLHLVDKFKFNVTNPSEQSSSTFNSIVLEDNINWYPVGIKKNLKEPRANNDTIKITNIKNYQKDWSITNIKYQNLLSLENNIYPIIYKKIEKQQELSVEDGNDR